MMRAVFTALVAVFAAVTAGAQSQALDLDPTASRFVVGDIRVEGLQRVSEGTVYNYLPVNIGDELSTQRLRESLLGV